MTRTPRTWSIRGPATRTATASGAALVPRARAGPKTATTPTAVRREAVFDLHPYVLEAAGLEAARRSVAQEAAARGRFRLRLDLHGHGVHAQDQLVFSAARELLTNVVRHAGASFVDVRLEERNGELVLVVGDDGCGVPAGRPEERLADGHIGLAAQRVRVEAAGGHMELLSTPGGGTRVELRVPGRAQGNGRAGG